MMQKPLSPNLTAYASMNNQSPENILTPIIQANLRGTCINDGRGKPLCQLEQIALSDIEIENSWKIVRVHDYFHLYIVQTPGALQSVQ